VLFRSSTGRAIRHESKFDLCPHVVAVSAGHPRPVWRFLVVADEHPITRLRVERGVGSPRSMATVGDEELSAVGHNRTHTDKSLKISARDLEHRESPHSTEAPIATECVESSTQPPRFELIDEAALDTFGPLGTTPSLHITLNLDLSAELIPLEECVVSAARIPGGRSPVCRCSK